MICTHKDCNEVTKAKGYCRLHYDRYRHTGSPEPSKYAIGRMQRRNNHPLVSIYKNIMARCYNKKSPQYKDYGGRGIAVCDRWLGVDGFANFVNDMQNRPTPEHSIDRKDNDGIYEPSNCKWSTRLEQNNNQRMRKDNSTGYTGVYWNKKGQKWEARRNYNKVEYDLGFYNTKEEAIKARQQFELEKGLI